MSRINIKFLTGRNNCTVSHIVEFSSRGLRDSFWESSVVFRVSPRNHRKLSVNDKTQIDCQISYLITLTTFWLSMFAEMSHTLWLIIFFTYVLDHFSLSPSLALQQHFFEWLPDTVFHYHWRHIFRGRREWWFHFLQREVSIMVSFVWLLGTKALLSLNVHAKVARS